MLPLFLSLLVVGGMELERHKWSIINLKVKASYLSSSRFCNNILEDYRQYNKVAKTSPRNQKTWVLVSTLDLSRCVTLTRSPNFLQINFPIYRISKEHKSGSEITPCSQNSLRVPLSLTSVRDSWIFRSCYMGIFPWYGKLGYISTSQFGVLFSSIIVLDFSTC